MAKGQRQAQRDVDEQRQDLRHGSLEIKALSAQVDENLKLAADWLASLEGRVETQVEVADPYPEPLTFVDSVFQLRLAKPKWTLEGRWTYDKQTLAVVVDYKPPEWQAVLSAPMSMKIAALHALPVLHAAMQDSQTSYINQLRESNQKFERFARAMGLVNGEGA